MAAFVRSGTGICAVLLVFSVVGARSGLLGAPAELPRTAYCFEVPLPINDAVEKSVTRRVEQAISRLPKTNERPIFVFEFRPTSGTAGEGSSYGDALDLARYLSGDRLSQAKVRTVAWVPKTIKG